MISFNVFLYISGRGHVLILRLVIGHKIQGTISKSGATGECDTCLSAIKEANATDSCFPALPHAAKHARLPTEIFQQPYLQKRVCAVKTLPDLCILTSELLLPSME